MLRINLSDDDELKGDCVAKHAMLMHRQSSNEDDLGFTHCPSGLSLLFPELSLPQPDSFWVRRIPL